MSGRHDELEQENERLRRDVLVANERIYAMVRRNAMLKAEVAVLRAIGQRATNVMRDLPLSAWSENLLTVADAVFFSKDKWAKLEALALRPLARPVTAADTKKVRP